MGGGPNVLGTESRYQVEQWSQLLIELSDFWCDGSFLQGLCEKYDDSCNRSNSNGQLQHFTVPAVAVKVLADMALHSQFSRIVYVKMSRYSKKQEILSKTIASMPLIYFGYLASDSDLS